MAVVKEVRRDGIVIRIHDDYCANLSEEEIQTILNRIASQAMETLSFAQDDREKTG